MNLAVPCYVVWVKEYSYVIGIGVHWYLMGVGWCFGVVIKMLKRVEAVLLQMSTRILRPVHVRLGCYGWVRVWLGLG